MIDHREKRIHLLALADKNTLTDASDWLKSTAARLNSFADCTPDTPEDLPDHLDLTAPFTPRHDKRHYIDLILKSQEYIRQGETYEICLTNTVTGKTDARSLGGITACYAAPIRRHTVPTSS